jgi:hypothetical protein
MKADLPAELDLLNRNVDELIRLCQCVTDAGIWTRHEGTTHTLRLESLRGKLNADFQELMTLRHCANEARDYPRK